MGEDHAATSAGDDGPGLARRSTAGQVSGLLVSNVVGAVIVFVTAAFVLPGDSGSNPGRTVVINLVLAVAYVVAAVVVGLVWGLKRARPSTRFLIDGRAATDEEVRALVRVPMRLAGMQLVLWGVAAVLFTLVDGIIDVRLIARVGFTVVLGGVTTCAITYLISERACRPVLARALGGEDRQLPRVPGVTARYLLAWALGTGIPVLGLVITAVFGLVDTRATKTQLAVTMLAVGGIALLVGLLAALLTARAVAAPVRSVEAGLAEVEGGDFDHRVPVFDASELGRLQLGFNRMAAGLAQREQLRDLFGRHVGVEVAREAVDRGVQLGGEEREVGVLFVDVVGSTSLAAASEPSHVVEVLNRFFDVVIEVVDRHGGWVNKFEGDAALAVFGAPEPVADPAGQALAAGRELAGRLPVAAAETPAGIGISFGTVVAGNVGGEQRFEYTVIGDPVNEAARLTEAAKQQPGRVLASMLTVERATGHEADCWRPCGQVTLRGRSDPTRLARPSSDRSA